MQQIKNILGVDTRLHSGDNFFTTKCGTLNLHSFPGTHWVLTVDKFGFHCNRTAPVESILNFFENCHEERVNSLC